MINTVGIIGLGYVGKAHREFFSKHYEVRIYDPDQGFHDRNSVSKSDLALICLPTPNRIDMRCDTTLVEDAVEWCDSQIILIKSTVEPGTTDLLQQRFGKRIVFSPEYCGESNYWSPYAWDKKIDEMPYYIFGGNPSDTNLLVETYMTVAGPTKKYIQTDAKKAEMAKYMKNAFYASKISFCYEMYEICSAANIDYNAVRELWLLDPRISPTHTAVFSRNDRPFAGKCLPKDLAALIEYAKTIEYSPNFLEEVSKTNIRIGETRGQRRSEDLARNKKSPSCGDSIG